MNICFVLPVPSDARIRRRISALQRAGVTSKILSFEREYYESGGPQLEYESLGHLKHGNYVRRGVPLLRAIRRIARASSRSDALYVFGFDLLIVALIARLVGRKRTILVYEVGDIRRVLMGDRVSARMLRAIERWAVKRSELMVVTSEAYVAGYYEGMLGLHRLRYKVLENKIESTAFADTEVAARSPRAHLSQQEPIVIGYFGLIRCHRSWNALKAIAQRANGRIRVVVRGMSMFDFDLSADAAGLPCLTVEGAYKSPDDVPGMYARIDLSWIAHLHGEANARWARANRFYEAGYFGKPMIAQVGTEDGRIVAEHGLGCCIDLRDLEATVETILGIGEQAIEGWRQSIGQAPRAMFCYASEHEELAATLRDLARGEVAPIRSSGSAVGRAPA